MKPQPQSKHVALEVEGWCVGALLDADGPILRSDARTLLPACNLTAEDFTRPDLVAYFRAISAIADRGRPVDARTTFATCRGAPGVPPDALEKLEALKGGNTADRAALMSHAEELRRLTRLRRLEAFHRAQLAALDLPRPDPVKLAGQAEAFAQTFAADAQPDETGEADVFELAEDWSAWEEGIRAPAVATGIEVLDQHLSGWVSNLNVIGGLPSVGKSALIAECIINQLKAGLRVGVFGLEDATKWIMKRHLSRALGIPVGAVAASRLTDQQQADCSREMGNLHHLARNLLVYRRAGITPEALLQRCRGWVLNQGVRCIYIDHGGEVQHAPGVARDRYDLAVAATYRGLRDLAVNHRVPVVVLAHFNRETDKLGRPRLSSFAETRYIEAMARVALGLWEREGDDRLLCTVLKATEGERDVTLWLKRQKAHALVSSIGGGLVDLAEEQRMAQEAARATAGNWRAHR